MSLILGTEHRILLADGRFHKLGDLVNTEVDGIGLFVSNFNKQKIVIKSSGTKIHLWDVVSSDGRQITCTDGTKFLGHKGEWEEFSHPSNRTRVRMKNIPIRVVNRISIYGKNRHNKYWVEALCNGIKASNEKYPYYVKIPEYLLEVDSDTLESVLYTLRAQFVNYTKKMYINKIQFSDQEVLFHLFDRSKKMRSKAKGYSRVVIGNRDSGWVNARKRTTRTAVSATKDPAAILRDDTIKFYYPAAKEQDSVVIESEFGNIVEKSFICQT